MEDLQKHAKSDMLEKENDDGDFKMVVTWRQKKKTQVQSNRRRFEKRGY